jgi:uncharacterized Rossmann fold enzyme
MGGAVHPQAAQALAEAAKAVESRRIAFVCVNVGQRYPMLYVEVLRDMVLRHMTESDADVAWFCVTNRADELPEGVNAIQADPALPGYWQKIRLFSPDMPWAEGQRVVYFDLDVCITGRLEDLVERKGIARDHGWPTYNSSVMVWDHGEHRDAWDRFHPDVMDMPGKLVAPHLLPADVPNGGDQEWLTEVGGWDLLSDDWCRSWRWDARCRTWPPEHCKVVIFHGQEKPADIADGWVPKLWKVGGLTAFPIVKGVNTAEDVRFDHIRASVKRELPWFTGFKDEGKSCVIVGGAPSLLDCREQIALHRKRGARLVSLNGAWRKLAAWGLTPDVNVMLDARPENVDLVRGAPASIRFLLASQVHPDVFDLLGGHEVVLWHCGFETGNDTIREILSPWWDGPDARPCVMVPGGSTVGLRALWLAAFSGFRTIHMYGMDSSYADDGAHHAYPQALNDQETTVELERQGKTYRCAPWMARQAAEFTETWNDLRNFVDPATGLPAPVSIYVHGRGLLPDIARGLREEARAA